QQQVHAVNAVVGFDGRIVNLWNQRIKKSKTTTKDQRTFVANGVGETHPRGKVIGVGGNFARLRPQGIRQQAIATKGLQLITRAQIEREMVSHAYGVLREPGKLMRIGMRDRVAEILLEKLGHAVSIGPQRAELLPAFLWNKGKRI